MHRVVLRAALQPGHAFRRVRQRQISRRVVGDDVFDHRQDRELDASDGVGGPAHGALIVACGRHGGLHGVHCGKNGSGRHRGDRYKCFV